MSPASLQYVPHSARVLCAGDDIGDQILMQCCLGGDLDFVTITSADEASAALETESSFDVVILDQRLDALGGLMFLDRLRHHSPDAERLIIVHTGVHAMSEMLENEHRVMRLLHAPFTADVLCGADSDALLRHRARAMRASMSPKVTMLGVHPCSMALTPRSNPLVS